MRATACVSDQMFLTLKEQTLDECGDVLSRACELTASGRQQAALASFVGMALAVSAIQSAPSRDEAELFAAHMQEQFAKMICVSLLHYGDANHDGQ